MTVSVTVLVLMLVLMLVLTLVVVSGVVVVVVVVVVVGAVVVVVVVVGSVVVAVTVSVTVLGEDAVVALVDLDVVVSGVSDVCSDGESPPVINLARPNTMSAITTAPIAPNATNAAGLRNQGTGSSPGGPRYCVGASLEWFGSSGGPPQPSLPATGTDTRRLRG